MAQAKALPLRDAEQDILRSLAEQNGRLPPWMAGFFLHKYQL